MIGCYPEFFGQLTGSIYERDDAGPRPGEPWDAHDVAGDAPTDTVGPVDASPAPWATDAMPWMIDDENDVTTVVEVTPDARDLLDPALVDLEPDWQMVDWFFFNEKSRLRGRLPTDAIAVYRPWHLHGDHWGIYVSSDALTTFTGGLSRMTGAPLGQLAPLALRQILEHEWTHFAFEVAGTEMEDVLDRLVYPGYVLRRFGTPRTAWSQGPLEEIVASWAEVEFAARPPRGFGKLKPRNYRRTVEQLLSLSPPGYSEWHWMADWDIARRSSPR